MQGSLHCGGTASGIKGSRQEFPPGQRGLNDAVWGVVRAVGEQGPSGGIQRVIFTQFFIKRESRDKRPDGCLG